MNFTERMNRIIRLAERELEDGSCTVLMPIHLLIACLQEKTGALGEIVLKGDFDIAALRVCTGAGETQPIGVEIPPFKFPISVEVQTVMEMAEGYMNRYNQNYINEGHLLKALIMAEVLNPFLTDENKKLILSHGTTARDMITHLGSYTFPENIWLNMVRKVTRDDSERLIAFIEENFSTEWSETIESGFSMEDSSIYIALDDHDNIIGFAAFDVFQNKKGYFGPMGVSLKNRTKGVGYSLLHHCLKDMKDIGYEYAIIGGAGPIEFYEKACMAVVIPAI